MSNEKINTAKAADAFIRDLDAYFYGPNFWQAGLYAQLKELIFEQALWKPSPERNCIWDIVRHLNSWKWFAVENLKGKRIESMKEYNWVKLPENPDEQKWKADVEKLKNLHEEFKGLVKNADFSFFDPSNDMSNYTREVIYHNCYHAGQIGILRVMQGLKPVV
ncbi:MAG: DinB family protein [Ignavibacteria bacterium]